MLHDPQDQSKPIPHPKDLWRDLYPTSPRIHLGAIGSANTLLKDASLRDRLRDEHGVRAIEMEGSGTADASWSAGRDYLVIRGICDYCDTHKNDDWQHYAALVAAAYARALIENLPCHPPRRPYDPGLIRNSGIDTTIDRSVAQSVAVVIEQMRSELGEVYAKRLESIIEKRGLGDIDTAWDELTAELAAMSGRSITRQVQARFYYQAARWAQEDGKPASQYKQYHQRALHLDPNFDHRTYRAFEAATEKRIDTVIAILRPFNTESVVVNLCRHLLDADRASEADDLLQPLETPITDEIRRMRALCRLAAGDPSGAWQMLEPAIPGQQDNALFQLTAGYIVFWQAMPVELQKSSTLLGPVLFQPGLISLDEQRVQRINESLTFLQAALSLVPARSENALRQDARNAVIAVSVLLPTHHAKAIEMAVAALSDDPIAPIPAWCLLQLGTNYDWTRTLDALTAACGDPLPHLWALDLLTELLLRTGKPESAWQYLERFQHRYSTDDEKGRWLEHAVRCLAHLGRLPELEPRLASLSASTEHRRLKAAYWSARREVAKTLAIAKDLVREPGELIDHINLVNLYSQQCMWVELASLADCCLRRFADAPVNVADALARARLELNEPAAALEILQAYRAAYERDGKLDDYYARCMSAHGALGHYQAAFDASEFLWQRHPNAQLLTQRAHLQFLLGEVPRALEILKQGIEQGFETPQILISIAQHSLSQSREEAFTWAQRAVERSPDDPQVRASAMQIAFDTGHSDWASMQLATLTRDFPDSGLFREANPPTLLNWMRERQTQSTAHWQSFCEGRHPFHFWVDAEHGSLGAEFYWRWHFNRERLPRKRVLFPLAFGGRSASTQLVKWKGRTLIMDYTACLTAHLLKLFSSLEKALDEILVPPSLFAIIPAEILRLSQIQTDRVERAEKLFARLKDDTITLLPAPNLEPGDFSGLLPTDRIKWQLAEQHGLWIVEDRFATEMFEAGDIPDGLHALRVSEASVVNVLRSSGELILERDWEKFSGQTSPRHCRTQLESGAGLLVDRPFLELLLELNGLEAGIRNFKLFCLNDILEQLRNEIEGYRYRQKIKGWLEGLLAELKRLKYKGKLKILAIRHSINDQSDDWPLAHELKELAYGAEEKSVPVWIDDRMLSSHLTIGNHSPIVGIHDILGLLHFRQAITDGKYLECHRELVHSGVICRLPPPKYLAEELKQAKIVPNTDEMTESLPLSRLRQTVAVALAPDGVLGKVPLRQGVLPEETQFKLQLLSLVDETMALIWTTDGLDYQHRAAMANWLFERFLPNSGRFITSEDFRSDLLQGLAFEQSLRIGLGWRFVGQPRAAKSYYHWLFSSLRLAWQNHPGLPVAVMSHFTDLIVGQLQNLSKLENSTQLIGRFVGPLKHLPPQILGLLLDHPKLKPIFKHYFATGKHIDGLDLFIPQEEWLDLLNECIDKGLGSSVSTTIKGREIDFKFIPGKGVGDLIAVSGETAIGRRVEACLLSPYARLEHRQAQHRLAWLNDLEKGGLLGYVEVDRWRESLKSEDPATAIKALHDACERSPNFFFARAGLALGILEPSEFDPNVILPEHPEILEVVASYADSAIADVSSLIACGKDITEINASVSKLAALPGGPPYDLATIVLRGLSSGQALSGEFRGVVEDLAQSSFNPVVLQNLLALFLQVPDLCGQGQLEEIVRNLLAVNPESQFEVAFDLYIDLLHLIWSHFQLSSEFSDKSYQQRVSWAYIYADRMLESLARQESKTPGCLAAAAKSIKEILAEQARQINPFGNRLEAEADVTLPSAASHWRTVTGGTLGVLNSNAAALGNIQRTLLDALGSLLDTLNRNDVRKWYGFEYLALSDYPPSPKNSSIGNRGWAIALEIHALLSGQEEPLEMQPRDFWLAALDEEDLNIVSGGYLLVLSRYPIPPDLQSPAAAVIDKIASSYVFNQETKPLFWAAASLLARLTDQVTGNLRARLFDRALAGVRDDKSLWIDVCELAFKLDHHGMLEDRVVCFIAALQKLVPMLPVESKEYGSFLSFLRRIEAYLPTWSWPHLWNVAEVIQSKGSR